MGKKWRYLEGDEKPFECIRCGARRKNEGGINLHWAQAHKAGDCEHAWRLLRPGSPVEANALGAGQTEVCEKCEEVR